MRSVTIARNYAEALFDLGVRSGDSERYAALIDAVAGAVETTPAVQAMLISPKVPKSKKAKLMGEALRDTPREFVLFLQAVIKRGRQALLREIATEYMTLLDARLNRVRAGVTLARDPDDALKRSIQAGLTTHLGKQVIANFSVDPAILGGAIVRVGERIHDGSVRRRMTRLRRQLLQR